MKQAIRHLLLLPIWLAANAIQAQVQTQEHALIVLQFNERPPFMKQLADGSVAGTAATPAARAFKKAGIPFVWQYTSVKRQLAVLQENAAPVCSVGWYKTAERERFAKFTKAISQDSPTIGLANANFKAQDNGKLADLLANRELDVLIKDSIIYGPYLDAQLTTMKAKRITSYEEFGSLIKLVRFGRAQLTFVPIEEANYYIESMGYSRTDFNIIHFSDMPSGEKRYIMCDMKVEDAVIEKLNAELK
jgi:polar amino acid transport system substrate-binding protein